MAIPSQLVKFSASLVNGSQDITSLNPSFDISTIKAGTVLYIKNGDKIYYVQSINHANKSLKITESYTGTTGTYNLSYIDSFTYPNMLPYPENGDTRTATIIGSSIKAFQNNINKHKGILSSLEDNITLSGGLFGGFSVVGLSSSFTNVDYVNTLIIQSGSNIHELPENIIRAKIYAQIEILADDTGTFRFYLSSSGNKLAAMDRQDVVSGDNIILSIETGVLDIYSTSFTTGISVANNLPSSAQSTLIAGPNTWFCMEIVN